MNEDKRLWFPLGVIVAALLAGVIGLPMVISDSNHRAEVCASKGGYIVKGGICIRSDSVIRLDP